MCIDVLKQQKMSRKLDTTSQTVSNESILVITTIYAYENCGVALVDIPGIFLTIDTDKEAILVL